MFSKVIRSLVVVPVLILVGTIGAAADSSGTGNNMTLTVPSAATLIARVAVPVTVKIQCTGGIDTSTFYYLNGPYYNSGASVTVSQASGRTVNSATGTTNQPILCDGAAHSYQVSVLANAPFRTGQAAITSSASWNEYVYGCSYVLGCGSFQASASASAQGPLTLSG
jgi:hypothetical protein